MSRTKAEKQALAYHKEKDNVYTLYDAPIAVTQSDFWRPVCEYCIGVNPKHTEYVLAVLTNGLSHACVTCGVRLGWVKLGEGVSTNDPSFHALEHASVVRCK